MAKERRYYLVTDLRYEIVLSPSHMALRLPDLPILREIPHFSLRLPPPGRQLPGRPNLPYLTRSIGRIETLCKSKLHSVFWRDERKLFLQPALESLVPFWLLSVNCEHRSVDMCWAFLLSVSLVSRIVTVNLLTQSYDQKLVRLLGHPGDTVTHKDFV